MKKTLFVLMMLIGLITSSTAQTKPANKPKEKSTTSSAKKADGTPDMRYKENKEKAKVEGPKKADGTPDMRYKENKIKTPPAKKKN